MDNYITKSRKEFKMAKKKSRKKSSKDYDFKLFLQSMTVVKIKEVIDYYNEKFVINGPKEELLKGFSTLKKTELVEFVDDAFSYRNYITKKLNYVETEIDIL